MSACHCWVKDGILACAGAAQINFIRNGIVHGRPLKDRTLLIARPRWCCWCGRREFVSQNCDGNCGRGHITVIGRRQFGDHGDFDVRDCVTVCIRIILTVTIMVCGVCQLAGVNVSC